MLFVITGPSGCGKTTLVRQVMKNVKDVQFSVSHTTRKKETQRKKAGIIILFQSLNLSR